MKKLNQLNQLCCQQLQGLKIILILHHYPFVCCYLCEKQMLITTLKMNRVLCFLTALKPDLGLSTDCQEIRQKTASPWQLVSLLSDIKQEKGVRGSIQSVWKVNVMLTDGTEKYCSDSNLHQFPAPLPHWSGLKVLVDLRDVLHDALPVRPVGLHQLLNVLFGTVRGVKEQWFRS